MGSVFFLMQCSTKYYHSIRIQNIYKLFKFFPGYGHITPMTRNGKLFSMVYALIGIPLSLLLISTTVKRLMNIINILYWLIEYLLERLCRPFTIKLLHFSIIGE